MIEAWSSKIKFMQHLLDSYLFLQFLNLVLLNVFHVSQVELCLHSMSSLVVEQLSST